MKKLYLSKDDSKIFGVCGGIGETYNLDPTLIRLGMVFFVCIDGGNTAGGGLHRRLGNYSGKTDRITG